MQIRPRDRVTVSTNFYFDFGQLGQANPQFADTQSKHPNCHQQLLHARATLLITIAHKAYVYAAIIEKFINWYGYSHFFQKGFPCNIAHPAWCGLSTMTDSQAKTFAAPVKLNADVLKRRAHCSFSNPVLDLVHHSSAECQVTCICMATHPQHTPSLTGLTLSELCPSHGEGWTHDYRAASTFVYNHFRNDLSQLASLRN